MRQIYLALDQTSDQQATLKAIKNINGVFNVSSFSEEYGRSAPENGYYAQLERPIWDWNQAEAIAKQIRKLPGIREASVCLSHFTI